MSIPIHVIGLNVKGFQCLPFCRRNRHDPSEGLRKKSGNSRISASDGICNGHQPEPCGQDIWILYYAIVLTIFFDLTRIASLGVIFYIVMDIVIHWGVLTRLRKKVSASPILLILAILVDVVILAAFLYMKIRSDLFVVILSLVLMVIIFVGEYFFLKKTGQNHLIIIQVNEIFWLPEKNRKHY